MVHIIGENRYERLENLNANVRVCALGYNLYHVFMFAYFISSIFYSSEL